MVLNPQRHRGTELLFRFSSLGNNIENLPSKILIRHNPFRAHTFGSGELSGSKAPVIRGEPVIS